MTKTSHSLFSSIFSNDRSNRITNGISRVLSQNSTVNSPIHSPINSPINSPVNSQFELPIAAKYSSNDCLQSSTNNYYQIEHSDLDANWYRRYFVEKGFLEPHEPIIISIIFDNKTKVNTSKEEVYWYRYIMRKKELKKCYKIGVLYCASSQQLEEEWFSNTTTSPIYENFLEILGNKVRLFGFKGFSGGLDTCNNGTGEYSIYDDETLKDFQIMYHVCTLIPYEKSDRHQITRKRHIGNDVICIVFQDVYKPFDPYSIRSQLLHVYVVVSPVRISMNKTSFRVDIVCKDGVPHFGPALPEPPIFDDPVELKKFLVATAPKLLDPFLRARGAILRDLVSKLVPPQPEFIAQPSLPRKISQEELNSTLKRLFREQLKLGIPPPLEQVKALLEKGANPNVKIPQPKSKSSSSSRDQIRIDQPSSSSSHTTHAIFHNHKDSSSSESDFTSLSSSYSSTATQQHSTRQKLPNILFALIVMCDDPLYCKLLINNGAETIPKDSNFPNASVFAKRYERFKILKCLKENLPGLNDSENDETNLNEDIEEIEEVQNENTESTEGSRETEEEREKKKS
ncbi:7057_t:CDS:2 [Diversispora eburnea]|uniref:7057_t:CDS:1 n=1 Tax=Diversispora eburnea TaxID=1213867 RepID=A0A9N8UXV6_9GLOM|nr:7057_t:CDS:2 [Diversispora eburnea]